MPRIITRVSHLPEYSRQNLTKPESTLPSRLQEMSLPSENTRANLLQDYQDQYQNWFDMSICYPSSGGLYYERDTVRPLERRIPRSEIALPIQTPQSYSDQNKRKREFTQIDANVSEDESFSTEKLGKGEKNEEDMSISANDDGPDNEKMSDKMEEYLEKRRKNNASAKKSRKARRMREIQTQFLSSYLEDENIKLLTIISALKTENSHLRQLMII